MNSLNIELRCLRDESVLLCVVIVVNRARSSLGGGETVLFSRIIMFWCRLWYFHLQLSMLCSSDIQFLKTPWPNWIATYSRRIRARLNFRLGNRVDDITPKSSLDLPVYLKNWLATRVRLIRGRVDNTRSGFQLQGGLQIQGRSFLSNNNLDGIVRWPIYCQGFVSSYLTHPGSGYGLDSGLIEGTVTLKIPICARIVNHSKVWNKNQ